MVVRMVFKLTERKRVTTCKSDRKALHVLLSVPLAHNLFICLFD